MSNDRQINQLISTLTEISKKLAQIDNKLGKIVKYQQKSMRGKLNRRSGNRVSTIQKNGLEGEVEQLILQGKTYREIIEIIRKKTGNNLSKSSISRYYQSKYGSKS